MRSCIVLLTSCDDVARGYEALSATVEAAVLVVVIIPVVMDYLKEVFPKAVLFLS